MSWLSLMVNQHLKQGYMLEGLLSRGSHGAEGLYLFQVLDFLLERLNR